MLSNERQASQRIVLQEASAGKYKYSTVQSCLNKSSYDLWQQQQSGASSPILSFTHNPIDDWERCSSAFLTQGTWEALFVQKFLRAKISTSVPFSDGAKTTLSDLLSPLVLKSKRSRGIRLTPINWVWCYVWQSHLQTLKAQYHKTWQIHDNQALSLRDPRKITLWKNSIFHTRYSLERLSLLDLVNWYSLFCQLAVLGQLWLDEVVQLRSSIVAIVGFFTVKFLT